MEETYLTNLDGRVANIYRAYLAHNADQKWGIVDRVLDMCIKFKPKVSFDATFLSLGLIYKSNGNMSFLTPTTRDVMLRVTVETLSADPQSSINLYMVRHLSVLRDNASAGGEKDYSFEKLVFLRLLVQHEKDIWIKYRDLAGFDYSVMLKIRHHMQIDGNTPPPDWKLMQVGTLVAHPREGGHRFDHVYYGENEVVFLDTTVSQYWETKIPSMTAAGANEFASIREKVAKWIGAERFRVEVRDSRLVAVPMISKKWKRGLGVTKECARSAVPTLRYVVLCPRPRHNCQPERTKAYGFIGICYDSLLDCSGLVQMEEISAFALGGTERME
ncbi:hypothetical protein HK097_000479 [Rhizophlyctis rosea]|uniref:Uncharacterized protein n=1 Tax=Rhizophlyctis rosea TaxID=64517 RepID=A0AAD5S6P1_9FUNG|nr:hypothetical protein HK097_000479 [Rhizophlyctis rosea]